MATSSYSNLFGTTGAGQQGSQAGIGTMFGQQARPQETEEERQRRQQQQPAQTFAQLQRQGMARPAPQAPQGQPFQRFGGSEQAQQARGGMLGQLQQQLAQPTRFDTQAFQQIRQAQAANLQSEFQEQQRQLNEDLARRGLSASNIAASGLGRLGGAQARALADIDAQLLQQAAQTQAEDRLRAMQAGAQFAELAGTQDLQQFEANRVAQAAEFEQALRGAQFGQQQTEFERGQALQAAQAQQAGQETAMDRALRERLGLGELTGDVDGRRTLAAQQQAEQARQFGVTTELERERLAAQQAQFGAQLGFNREELALRGDLGRGEQQLAERRLAQEGRLEQARQDIQMKQLAQQEAQVRAELTGQVDVPVLDGQGRPTGAIQRINTIARDRLGQEGMQLAMQRAQQMTQATGMVYDLDNNGNVVQKMVGGEPVRTESALARLSQQEIQRAEIAGYAYIPNPDDPTKTIRVDSLGARQLSQQQLRDAAAQAESLSQQTGIAYEVGPDGRLRQMTQVVNGQTVPMTTVQARQLEAQERQANLDRELRETLGMGELTGTVGGQATLASRQMGLAAQQQYFAQAQAQQQLLVQLAGALSQATNIDEKTKKDMFNAIYSRTMTAPGAGGFGDWLSTLNFMLGGGSLSGNPPPGTPSGTPPVTPPPTTTATTTQPTGEAPNDFVTGENIARMQQLFPELGLAQIIARLQGGFDPSQYFPGA